MTPNNNLFPLPWYKSVKYQDFRKSYAYGNVFQLIAPDRSLLPFQIRRAHRASAAFTLRVLYDDGTLYRNISTDAAADLHVVSGTDFDIIQYCNSGLANQFAQPLAPGRYYAELSDGVETWYSEVFNVVDDLSRYIRLEYWSADNQEYDGGEIAYLNGYRNVLYICSELGKPDYEYEEEADPRDGFPFVEKQISKKTFRFECKAPEYLVDALRVVWLSDYVRMTANGQQYEVMHFLSDPNWQEDGHYAMVECEVEADTVIKKIGVGLTTLAGLPIQFRVKVVDAVTGASIPGVDIGISFNGSELASIYSDSSGRVVWNYDQTADLWNADYAGGRMRIYKKTPDAAALLDSESRILYDSLGRALRVPGGQDDYFDGEVYAELVRYLPSVEEGYDITIKLIKKSDFVLTPTTVEIPVIGGRRELTVSPGLFPIKRWNGADWLVSTMQGYSGIVLSAEATEYERDTAAEFGPDAYGCLGRRSVAVHQQGTALVSRSINFRLSILDEQGAPVSADQTHIYWQGADGTKRHIGFAYYDVIETVLDGASVLAFNLEVTVSEPGFKTFTTEIPIPAGTDEYSWEGSVTLRKSRRNLVLDFSVLDENDTLIEDAEVLVFYTDESGEETTYGSRQGRVQATVPGVTTDAFSLGIAAGREGYQTYEHIIQVPAGSEDYPYTADVKLTPVAAQSRNLNLDITITDQDGHAVNAQTVEITYTKSDGSRATYKTSGSTITGAISDVSTSRFMIRTIVVAAGYGAQMKELALLAGTSDYLYRETFALQPVAVTSRNLVLNLSIQNAEGAAVDAQSVEVRYTKSDDTEGTLTTSGSHITDTIPNVTTAYFTATITVQTDGYQLWRGPVSVPAGTGDSTVEETITLTAEEIPGRNLILDVRIIDEASQPVSADSVEIAYTKKDGTRDKYITSGSSVKQTIPDVSTAYFPVAYTANANGYKTDSGVWNAEAGTADKTINGVIRLESLAPASNRDLELKFNVTDSSGQPVSADSIRVSYTKSDGSAGQYTGTGSSVDTVLSDATRDQFTLAVAVSAAGYENYSNSVTVPAGAEKYTYAVAAQLTTEPKRRLILQLAFETLNGDAVAVDKVTVSTKDAAGGTMTREYTNVTAVDDTFDDIPTSDSSVTVTAVKSGFTDVRITRSIPAGESDYTYTDTIEIGAERLFSAELHVTDKAGQPVVADEITFTWLNSTGTTNTERREHTSSLTYGPVSNCTAEAFTMNITAKAAGYDSIEDHIDVPAGTEPYTAQKTIQLAPGSRNLVLDFTVSDKDGAPISGVGVGFRYIDANGEENSYMADTDASGRISATIDNATIQSFDALVIAYLDGWRLSLREFTVPAGTDDYTYDRNITLYDSYDPLVTFSRELPWPSSGTLIAMHNSGNVALTLQSMPAWCQGTKDLPLDIPVEGGYTFAVVKNETGAVRTGTLAMQYHNTETGETVAYNVDVTQEG